MWLDDKSKNLIKWVHLHFVVEYFYTYVHACGPTLLANETDPPNHLFYARMIGFEKKKKRKIINVHGSGAMREMRAQ